MKPELANGATDERSLPISDMQAAMLQQAEAAVQAAQQKLGTIAATILAGHGVVSGTLLRIEPGDPPVLVVKIGD